MNISQELDFSFSPEILNTFPSKIYVCTTGITKTELQCYEIPPHVILQEKLTLSTNYLIAHRSIITPKYNQAYKWKIPILKPSFFINNTINRVKLYEGLIFTTNNIYNQIYINYFTNQGAIYSDILTNVTDFMISDISSEKEEFCLKKGIPIIKTNEVFLNDLNLFVKKEPIPLIKAGLELFSEKVFLVDERLPKNIFNKLKRIILKNNGRRVSLECDSVDFILTDKFDDNFKQKEKLFYYFFIFDCDNCNGFIMPDIYAVYKSKMVNLFNNSTFFISLEDKIETSNKIRSLGGKVVNKNGNYVNYHIVDKKELSHNEKTVDWLNECLSTLKVTKESKPTLFTDCKRILYLQPKRKIFQFTGLPTLFKNKAIELLKSYNLTYVDSETFYHEKEMTTHLIMGKINTSEKFLSAVANGCWILKPEFIDEFDNSDNFNYSKYEWVLDDTIEKHDRRLVGCIRPWRRYVANTNKPAFFNWRVKFYCDDEKKMNYQRVIINGGGVIDNNDFNLIIKSKNYKDEVPESDVKSTDYIFLYLYRRQE